MENAVSAVHRILIGENPWSFLLEVSLRSAVIYAVLFVTMRLMGKRMAAQLSVSELAVMITLGAAVGVPLQTAEQGVLPAAVLLVCALVFQRGLSTLSFRRRSIEVRIQGDVTLLLVDGRLLMDNLTASRLTPARVFSELRAQDVTQLGELRRVYLESTGDLSIVRFKRPRDGLRLMPPARQAPEASRRYPGRLACCRCGHVCELRPNSQTKQCEYCSNSHWSVAVGQDMQSELYDEDGSDNRLQ
jgi:uncharacterized membrane protein YcaP (DUF421 family)